MRACWRRKTAAECSAGWSALREDERNDFALRRDARELCRGLIEVAARAHGVAGVLCADLHPKNPALHYLVALNARPPLSAGLAVAAVHTQMARGGASTMIGADAPQVLAGAHLPSAPQLRRLLAARLAYERLDARR